MSRIKIRKKRNIVHISKCVDKIMHFIFFKIKKLITSVSFILQINHMFQQLRIHSVNSFINIGPFQLTYSHSIEHVNFNHLSHLHCLVMIMYLVHYGGINSGTN